MDPSKRTSTRRATSSARTATRWRRSSPSCARAPRRRRGRAAARSTSSGTAQQGKLPVRERIERLLDPGSPFLELSPLAAFGMYDDDAPARRASSPASAASPAARWSIVANDATVKGGTYYPMTVKKHVRAQQIALENRLPCVYLVDSGGAFLPLQAEVFPDREHFGRIFFNQARMSAERHPADRRRDGLVHRGRRLRAGDVRRDRHRQGHRHDLPRRPAAREGGDRRGSHAPRSSAAPTCTRASPASPTTSPKTTTHALAPRAHDRVDAAHRPSACRPT